MAFFLEKINFFKENQNKSNVFLENFFSMENEDKLEKSRNSKCGDLGKVSGVRFQASWAAGGHVCFCLTSRIIVVILFR